MDFITNNLALLAGGSAGILLWILIKIPNEKIYRLEETSCFTAGKIMTLGLSKWKITRKVWNATIEPYFVDLVDNTVGAAIKGFIKGLRSDN